jgi:hypothetical protein
MKATKRGGRILTKAFPVPGKEKDLVRRPTVGLFVELADVRYEGRPSIAGRIDEAESWWDLRQW